MEKEFGIVGRCGKASFDHHAENPRLLPMTFLEYIMDDAGCICGARYVIDLGHGYGFDNGTQVVDLRVGEEFKFEHEYTDTSDGTWDNDSYRVAVRLIEK